MKAYQNNIIYFAETNYRNDRRLFGVFQKDKIYHMLITGKTGTGKSSLLETNILQEIESGIGSVVVFDPNGDLIQNIIGNCSLESRKKLIIIDPSDEQCTYGYNPIKNVSEHHKPLVISGVIEIFKRLYGSSWGVRLEHILRHCLHLLLEQKHSTLADIPRILVDQEFRYQCRLRTQKDFIHQFWLKEFPKYRAEAILPLLSKLGSFINHPAVQRSIVNPKHDLFLRHVIDNKKVILVAISKGKLGMDVSSFIGSLLVTSLSLAVYSRANKMEWQRPYCSLYMDEFQNFSSTSLISAFSEVRKYNLAITVATQYLSALRPEIRDSVLGNVGSIITFRVSFDDAKVLAKYLYPTFTAEQIAGLPNHHICLALMIHGVLSIPFSAKTITYMELIRKR